MEKVLILLRGCPGSGKSTVAKLLFPDAKAFAADDYQVDENGNYDWKPERLGYAHTMCTSGVENAMREQHPQVVVHNTLTSEREIRPYAEFAAKYGYKLISFVVENRHGNSNVHSVPDAKVVEMSERIIKSIKLIP